MSVAWNRIAYFLSPQFDIYCCLAHIVRGKVADIGFGTGFGTQLFCTRADEVHGFEIDPEAVRFARRAFPRENLTFSYGSIADGIVGTYDFVVMIDVIEHIEDDVAALKNVKRILKPKGFLLCSTPNRLARYRKSDNHIREYSPDQFKALLGKVFGVVDLRNYKFREVSNQYENPMIGVCVNK